MGLKEHIQAGANLVRKDVSFTTTYPDNSGSFTTDAASLILGLSVNNPCRLRIYEDTGSLNNAGEAARPYNVGVSGSIALVADISASTAGTYTIDPALYLITRDFLTPEAYYRVDASSAVSVSLNTFLLEDGSISASAGTPYVTANKRTVSVNETSVKSTDYRTGTLNSGATPRTYLLVSSSLTATDQEVRLRLYSTQDSLTDATEVSRSFSVPTDPDSNLITDMILSGSDISHFSPKIIGANLSTMGTDLSLIRTNKNSVDGVSGMYYILQNLNTGTTESIEVNLNIYTLEE